MPPGQPVWLAVKRILPKPPTQEVWRGKNMNSIPTSLQLFDIDTLIRDLPRGERWLRHLREDLLPFWTTPDALGKPIGNFPTYRNNDGSLVDPMHLKPEFERAVPGIVWLDRDHVRAKSRQCFGYGV